VDAASDISEFLTSRRAKVTPEQAGLPSYGKRRVPGLRREEVASLAGVSVEYYKRLERGNVSGVSDLVLEALSRALQLDDAERAHLFDLARAAGPVAPRQRRPAKPRIRPVIQRILDKLDAPAILRGPHGDYLGATSSAARSTRRCSRAPSSRPTAPASRSSTPRRSTSTPTGNAWPRISSPTCARKPDATHTTAA
jgi:transcriptional regulator with XRE-family HTH domain